MTLEELLKEILSEDNDVKRTGLPIEAIEQHLIMKGVEGDSMRIRERANAILLRESKKPDGVFLKVMNPKTKKHKRGWYKIRQPKKPVPLPEPTENSQDIEQIKDNQDTNLAEPRPTSNFEGKAGEYAVMAELLMNGYNANNMSVDEGIDIIASKDNMFYFLQVKTTTLDSQYRAYAKIKVKNFDAYISGNMRYIIAVRCGKGEFRFFKFNYGHLKQFIHEGCINESSQYINIKIRFDMSSHLPMLYDKKEREISFFQNNFDLTL